MRLRVVGIERQAALPAGHRLIPLQQSGVDHSQTVQSQGRVGLQPQGLAIAMGGLGQFVQGGQGVAQVIEGVGELRPQGQRLLKQRTASSARFCI